MVVHEGAFSCLAAQSSSKADNRQKQSVNSHKSLSIKTCASFFTYANVSAAPFPADAGGKAYSSI
jgi:hypothetical protein